MLRSFQLLVLLTPLLAGQSGRDAQTSPQTKAGTPPARATAAAHPATSAKAGLPPLIDRELLFGNPEIVGAQLSPDGQYFAFLKPYNGVLNIWMKQTTEPFSAARLVTAELKRPVSSYLWTRNSKYICYVKDNDGDENYNLYAVDPSSVPAQGAIAPVSRDLTGLKGVRVQLYAAPKAEPDTLYIGLNDRDKAWHDVYKLSLSTGEKTLVRENKDHIAGWIFDLKGQLRLGTRTIENGDSEILRPAADSFERIYSCSVFESCAVLRFHPDGVHVYLVTNKGEENDLAGLAMLDVFTTQIVTVETDPLKRVDVSGAEFSETTDELAFTSYTDDRVRRYFRSHEYESDYKWLEEKLPGMEVSVASRSADDRIWLVTAQSDIEPGEAFLFDRKARTLALQYRIREKLQRELLAHMHAIRYSSSDGLEIPAYLMLPKGLPEKGLPLVVAPHGGPWAREIWAYNPLAQFLANRGYAVLLPNFRGSTGYGKKFLNAGNGEWGKKMQDDIAWGVKHLVSQGTVDPKRVGILGGSYGGYAVLAGLAFTPELYRVGVDIVGPSNLKTLLDAIPPYWEAMRKMMYARMADPQTAEGKAWLKERSPLTAADKIKAGLLVVQGANDPQVNKAETEQIVAALRDRGFSVEYLLASDEGHGFVRPMNSLALFMAAEKFLAKQLDGRYQDSGSPEVVKRLAEITVDPKTITVTKRVEPSAIEVPILAAELKPGTYKYRTKVAMSGQEFSFNSSTIIKDEDGAWTVIEVDEMPMGVASDKSILEKGTLAVRKRNINQGGAVIEVTYTKDRVSISASQQGDIRHVSADLSGPLFASAAGSLHSIGCLPLKPGYTLVYRSFDLQKQKEKLTRLSVAGAESVSVPGGTFDAYKVELTSTDGGSEKATVWIDKDSHTPVRMASVVGTGSIVTELTGK